MSNLAYYPAMLAPYFSASGQDFYVLRDSRSRKILNVAPTEHGLTWTTSWSGKLLYYTNAKIKITPEFVYLVSNNNQPLTKSNQVYVEKLNYGKMPNTDLGN